MAEELNPEKLWRALLTGTHPLQVRYRRLYRLIPSDPRCYLCDAPFGNPGASVMRLLGRTQSNLNPRFCNICDLFAKSHPGGAEIELAMLFADVRGSTALAEQMSALDFSQLINRFYVAATDVLTRSNALIDRLVGDQIIGLYLPGFVGPAYVRAAVQAARELLEATGHTDPEGPWLPVGIGVHTGTAFVGAVGTEGSVTNITALGDSVNIAARLSSQARPGEILVSEAASDASGLETGGLEMRELELKGRNEYVRVRVLPVAPASENSRSVS